MPLYTYDCGECGPFEAWSPMAEAERTCACPACNGAGLRQVSAPRLNLMNGTLRQALGRSERSGSEPRKVKRQHLANCGCKLCAVRGKPSSPMRKWMIGH